MFKKELTYILTEERGIPSFDPLHSDTLLNQNFDEHLVGTLLKYAANGSYEPFLASSWNSKDSGLRWEFQFRQGLTCSDGSPITTLLYAQNLHRLFKLYLKMNKTLPVFEHMKGFHEFKDGTANQLTGLNASNETLTFHFDTYPDGLLEFLSMPFYGFYCDANFDKNGEWKDPKNIISSGSHTLISVNTQEVVLAKRPGWFSHLPHSADIVRVKMLSFEEAKNLTTPHLLIQRRIENPQEIPNGFRKFLGTPTDLVAIVLSPYRRGPLQSPENRRKLNENIRWVQSRVQLESEISKPTVSFYPNKKVIDITEPHSHSGEALKSETTLLAVVSNVLNRPQRTYIESILNQATNNLALKIRFENEDRTKPGWKERLDDLKDMDLRVVRVDIGGSYEPWVVRMMFCSRLGVSFPDPSGRICKLANNLSDRSFETSKNFENVVAEDATVIPLFHSSFSWIASKDINMDRFSPTANLIRFDLIELE
jgi:MarR-like DNA-binding transcriptional regulator SgrR of sgrS sRNA